MKEKDRDIRSTALFLNADSLQVLLLTFKIVSMMKTNVHTSITIRLIEKVMKTLKHIHMEHVLHMIV